jgi:hypothetical protein
MAYWEGEDVDADSGLNHIAKAIATLVVLRDAQMQGKIIDDRPIRTTDAEWLANLNKIASGLVDEIPNPKEAYTHEGNA